MHIYKIVYCSSAVLTINIKLRTYCSKCPRIAGQYKYKCFSHNNYYCVTHSRPSRNNIIIIVHQLKRRL